MARITANPQADVDAGFDIAQPGVYPMRIEGSPNMPAVSEFDSKKTPGNKGIKIRLVFADPTAVMKEDGTPAKHLGSIIDNSVLTSPAEKQGKLRSLVEAAGLPWTDFDTEDLVGKEVMVKVEVEIYNGDKKNTARRYVKRA